MLRLSDGRHPVTGRRRQKQNKLQPRECLRWSVNTTRSLTQCCVIWITHWDVNAHTELNDVLHMMLIKILRIKNLPVKKTNTAFECKDENSSLDLQTASSEVWCVIALQAGGKQCSTFTEHNNVHMHTHSEDHEGGLHDFISNIYWTGESTLSFMCSCKPGTLRLHYWNIWCTDDDTGKANQQRRDLLLLRKTSNDFPYFLFLWWTLILEFPKLCWNSLVPSAKSKVSGLNLRC